MSSATAASPARVVDLPELRDRIRVFRDRAHAGEVLAGLLAGALPPATSLLAIPAGGVPVAAEVARHRRVPFGLAIVSKILVPGNTEAGYGAVAFDGTVQLNQPLVAALGLSEASVAAGIAATREKVARRVRLLLRGRPFPELQDASAVLIDDGLASGFTMQVAAAALRHCGAAAVHVAVPTGHRAAVESLASRVETVYCANIRSGPSFAVADAYLRWTDVSEDEVRAFLIPPR